MDAALCPCQAWMPWPWPTGAAFRSPSGFLQALSRSQQSRDRGERSLHELFARRGPGPPWDRMAGAISAVLFLDQRGKPVLMRDFRCGVDCASGLRGPAQSSC